MKGEIAMKKKVRLLACGMSVGLMLSITAVNAEEIILRDASDCEARITLTRGNGKFEVFENVLPPNTPKRIDGVYKTIDINDVIQTQVVKKSLNSGQLSQMKYAGDSKITYSGSMAYYLYDRYAGSLSKVY